MGVLTKIFMQISVQIFQLVPTVAEGRDEVTARGADRLMSTIHNLPSVCAFFQVYSLSDGLATEGHDCCVTITESLPLISVRYFMFMLATQRPDRHQDVLVIAVILA